MSSGERWPEQRLVACLAPGDGGVAFVAGRGVGKAVQRNRARRLLRAAWDVVGREVREGVDIVLIARRGILQSGSGEAARDLEATLRRAGALRR